MGYIDRWNYQIPLTNRDQGVRRGLLPGAAAGTVRRALSWCARVLDAVIRKRILGSEVHAANTVLLANKRYRGLTVTRKNPAGASRTPTRFSMICCFRLRYNASAGTNVVQEPPRRGIPTGIT